MALAAHEGIGLVRLDMRIGLIRLDVPIVEAADGSHVHRCLRVLDVRISSDCNTAMIAPQAGVAQDSLTVLVLS